MPRGPAVLIAVALLAAALPALAVDGATPLPNTSVYATPIVISQPGKYVVTRNLGPTGPGPVIDIVLGPITGDVELDLNGFTVDNLANPGFPAIQISPAAGVVHRVTIRGGSTRGGLNGIAAVSPGGPPLPRRVVIEDVFVADTAGAGILLQDVEVFAVRRCVVDGTVGIGIYVADTGGLWAKQGVIEHNQIREAGDGIVAMWVQDIEVSHNRVKMIMGGPFGGVGIYLDLCEAALVSHNVIEDVTGPMGDGIFFADSRGKIYNNAVRRALGRGIHLSLAANDTLILDNVVRECGNDGVFIEGVGNHIERNVMNTNGTAGFGFGLHLAGTSSLNNYGRNTAVGNIGGPCIAFTTGDFCDDAGPPSAVNFTFGDNLMPGPFGIF